MDQTQATHDVFDFLDEVFALQKEAASKPAQPAKPIKKAQRR